MNQAYLTLRTCSHARCHPDHCQGSLEEMACPQRGLEADGTHRVWLICELPEESVRVKALSVTSLTV